MMEFQMATRYISSNAAANDFEALLLQVDETGDEVVLQIDGEPIARIVPLSIAVRNEIARERFAKFWDPHKAAMLREPNNLTEDEVAELVDREIRVYRAEKAAEARQRGQLSSSSTRS